MDAGVGRLGVVRAVFEHRHIGHRGAAHQSALQQVMAQHLPIGKPPAQHLVHRRYIEQALAGKGALPEYVLVHLGTGGAVGINAELPGKQPVIEGARMFPRQRCRHPGLQHAVALHDGAGRRVKDRLVAGVGRNTHQRAQSPGRQLGVGVQRDHIGRAGHDVAQSA